MANLASDMQVLARAQKAALDVVAADPDLKSPGNRAMGARIQKLFELSAETLN